MLDAQSVNATATFLSYAETGVWEPTIQNVGVLYEPQGTSYVNQSSGDVVQREERILGPLGLDQYVEEGDRVSLSYRGERFEWRVTNFQSRSIDGFEGYTQMEFEDFGDDETEDSGGSDWDIGA